MEQIFIHKQVSQIVISLDEYKELLVTKGKYESLKEQTSINLDEIKTEYVSKDLIIDLIKSRIESSKKLKINYSSNSEPFRFIDYSNVLLRDIIDKIKSVEIK